MAKLNINVTDTKDLITQAKNLTREQQKEAQLARLLINQGALPELREGQTGKFVQMSNVFFKSKTLNEASFMAGLTTVGVAAGLDASDVLETYNNEAIAMALCNTIQKMTEAKYAKRSQADVETIVAYISKNLQKFGREAREARVNLGVVVAVEQQTMRDLAKLKQIANDKAETSEKE